MSQERIQQELVRRMRCGMPCQFSLGGMRLLARSTCDKGMKPYVIRGEESLL